jgi:hypothetical protein
MYKRTWSVALDPSNSNLKVITVTVAIASGVQLADLVASPITTLIAERANF